MRTILQITDSNHPCNIRNPRENTPTQLIPITLPGMHNIYRKPYKRYLTTYLAVIMSLGNILATTSVCMKFKTTFDKFVH